jgi:hypothetical protein
MTCSLFVYHISRSSPDLAVIKCSVRTVSRSSNSSNSSITSYASPRIVNHRLGLTSLSCKKRHICRCSRRRNVCLSARSADPTVFGSTTRKYEHRVPFSHASCYHPPTSVMLALTRHGPLKRACLNRGLRGFLCARGFLRARGFLCMHAALSMRIAFARLPSSHFTRPSSLPSPSV